MNYRRAVITPGQREAISHFSLSAVIKPLKFLPGAEQSRTSRFHFMAQRSAHAVVPIALLVFGLVAILLLTIPTEDVQEAPEFMVRSVPWGVFGCVKLLE